MCKPNQYINNICTDCHPRDYVMTLAEFADQLEVIELIGGDEGESFTQYLYECWVRSNAVK